MSKQDRQGVRTATDLERKYNFGKTFAEIMGLVSDARESVDSLESELRDEITRQVTAITRDTERIILEALKEYVKEDEFESVSGTIQSEMSVMADRISLNVTSIETAQKTADEAKEEIESLKGYVEGLDGLFFYIRYSEHADGQDMTEAPTDATLYMGTCSTNTDVAPTDPSAYTWARVRGNDGRDGQDGTPGADGADGKTQYLHIKYSDDGKTFTDNDGETLGAWIGTKVDFTEADSTNFSDYTWKRFTEDVDIGGRNLLQKSDPTKYLSDWLPWNNATAAISEDGWLHVVKADGASSCGYYPPKISSFPAGKYVVSFEAYSDTETSLNYNYIMAQGGNSMISEVNISSAPARYTIQLSPDAAAEDCSVMLGTTTGDSFYIRNLKVERGDVATDWTPAPEDVDSSISDAQSSANSAQSTADGAASRVTEAESEIEILKDMISALVTDENGSSLMTQTSNGWTFNLSGVLNSLSSANEGIDDLEKEVGEANSIIDNLKKAVDEFGILTDYVIITSYNDQPCIELGEADSEFKLRITNTNIEFVSGPVIPAHISNNKLLIEQAEVVNELQFGSEDDALCDGVWVWKQRANGNLGLMWKGDN